MVYDFVWGLVIRDLQVRFGGLPSASPPVLSDEGRQDPGYDGGTAQEVGAEVTTTQETHRKQHGQWNHGLLQEEDERAGHEVPPSATSKGFGPPAEITISAPYWDFR